MFEGHLTKNLKDGEEVLRFVRRYPWSFFVPALVAFVLLLAPFFFLFPLLRWGIPGVAVLTVLLLAGVLLAVRLVVLYALNVLLITNVRLIDVDQRGLFHREVSECTYDRVADVSFSMKGVLQTILRYGNVHIQTAGAQANIEVANVRNPERVQELIMKLQTEYQKEGRASESLSADELLTLVRRLKDGLGEERFRRLVRRK